MPHGDVVWAKMARFPWWPAVIVNEAEMPEKLRVGNSDSLPLRFFGTKDYQRLPRKKVKRILCTDWVMFAANKNRGLRNALGDLKEYCQENDLLDILEVVFGESVSSKSESGVSESESDDNAGEPAPATTTAEGSTANATHREVGFQGSRRPPPAQPPSWNMPSLLPKAARVRRNEDDDDSDYQPSDAASNYSISGNEEQPDEPDGGEGGPIQEICSPALCSRNTR